MSYLFSYRYFFSPLVPFKSVDMIKKSSVYLSLFLSVLILLGSCKEDDPEPLMAEIQAVLLAGEMGSSKSWKLTSASYKEGAKPSENFDLTLCFLDNIYLFSNNADQSYRASEGATRCDSADPDVVEAGNWAFTLDGEILIVLSDELSGSDNVLFSFLTYPSEVVALTENSMLLRMSIVEPGTSYTYTLTFVKI